MGFALNIQMLSAMATQLPFEHYTKPSNGLGQDFSHSGQGMMPMAASATSLLPMVTAGKLRKTPFV